MIFDSHAHYDDDKYNDVLPNLIEDMKKQGVSKIVNIASDFSSIEKCYNLAKDYDIIYCTAGIHPIYANDKPDDYLSVIENYLKNEKVVAIGEIGLDYYYDNIPKDVQKKVFEEQLILAKRLNVPVVIHCRDAYEDTIKLLKEYRPKAVMHCYSGSSEMAKEFLKLGIYISFTGVVTFKNAIKSIEALKQVPLDKLLIETDCPYMAPEPKRGTVNNSANIHYIASKYAEAKGMTKEDILKLTYDNGLKFFGLV
ncbi:MAG: TatD family hydrolase [Oscillospiraceae bacterium]